MKKIIVSMSVLGLFLTGCGTPCKDLITLTKCGLKVNKADEEQLAKNEKDCSAWPEAQQTKFLECMKREEKSFCAAQKKYHADNSDTAAHAEANAILQKCTAERQTK